MLFESAPIPQVRFLAQVEGERRPTAWFVLAVASGGRDEADSWQYRLVTHVSSVVFCGVL